MGWILVRECARAAQPETGTGGSYGLLPPRVVPRPESGTTNVVLTDYYSGRPQNVSVSYPLPRGLKVRPALGGNDMLLIYLGIPLG